MSRDRQQPRRTPRTVAALEGATTYRGRSCTHGHAPVRYVSNGVCTTCARLWRRQQQDQQNAMAGVQRRAFRTSTPHPETAA